MSVTKTKKVFVRCYIQYRTLYLAQFIFAIPLQVVKEEKKEAIPLPMDLESLDSPELGEEEATPAVAVQLGSLRNISFQDRTEGA